VFKMFHCFVNYGVIQQDSNQHATMKPVILEEIMEMHCQQIRDLIACEKCYPVDHAQFYNKYAKLISKEVCLKLTFGYFWSTFCSVCSVACNPINKVLSRPEKNVSLLIVAITLSIVPTNFSNFWHVYTIVN